MLIYLAMKPSSFDLKCNLDVLWFVECRILLTLFLNYFLYFLSLQFCIFNFFWYTATSNLKTWDLIFNHYFISYYIAQKSNTLGTVRHRIENRMIYGILSFWPNQADAMSVVQVYISNCESIFSSFFQIFAVTITQTIIKIDVALHLCSSHNGSTLL